MTKRCPGRNSALFAAALLSGLCALPPAGAEMAKAPPAKPALHTRYSEEREACSDANPNGNAYFGDLHIHTGFSYDARPFGIDVTPADAYRFAKGGVITLPPYAPRGTAPKTVELKRPLDFAAVTDHSEFFGELELCTDPESQVYNDKLCIMLREGGGEGMFPFIKGVVAQKPERLEGICGPDGTGCDAPAASLWQVTQDMAQAAYDRSASCQFTSFIAYEYTGTPNGNNLHRNVIFRNDRVPQQATSYIDEPTAQRLWRALKANCLEAANGCDVLAIPHNSNLSSGAMFPSAMAATEDKAAARAFAQLRNQMEPIMELFQHKANSECFNGFPDILGDVDELCNIEQFRTLGQKQGPGGKPYSVEICKDGEPMGGAFVGRGCISKNDFYRSVLLTGMQDQVSLGINSYKLGAIASTDTHLGLAGHTSETDWAGHLLDETTLEGRLEEKKVSPRSLSANPGGLAGIWAPENSRDALFDAMRRREVFGTTGTRIQPRLFAGWGYSKNACSKANLAAYGYSGGVPMGSVMPAPPQPGSGTSASLKPRLIVSAMGDSASAPLEKLQVIKGWIDAQGTLRTKVIDVVRAGPQQSSAPSTLCAVFEDADFDASEMAYYYLRAVEHPTLRWSAAQCAAMPVSQRPKACANEGAKTTQELAWTSPIWYEPVGAGN